MPEEIIGLLFVVFFGGVIVLIGCCIVVWILGAIRSVGQKSTRRTGGQQLRLVCDVTAVRQEHGLRGDNSQ